MHPTIIQRFTRSPGFRSRRSPTRGGGVTSLVLGGATLIGCSNEEASSAEQIAQGKQIFRYETFGDETKWTDTLRMEEVIRTVDPTTALSVGLKVDSDAL